MFCSDSIVEHNRLLQLKKWLRNCGYPEALINEKFFKARLQGPAPKPNDCKTVVPFVTTNFANFDSSNITSISKNLFQRSRNDRVTEVFRDFQPILSLRQPKNLLRRLSKSEFCSSPPALKDDLEPGLYRCVSNSCLLCKHGYIQECQSFVTSNETEWKIKCHISCNSKNVIYYLKCTACNFMSYTGKTNDFRKRMNNHKSSCNLGNSSDIFDNHVYNCRKRLNYFDTPMFLIYAFLTVKDPELLIPYESHIHSLGFDTMN